MFLVLLPSFGKREYNYEFKGLRMNLNAMHM